MVLMIKRIMATTTIIVDVEDIVADTIVVDTITVDRIIIIIPIALIVEVEVAIVEDIVVVEMDVDPTQTRTEMKVTTEEVAASMKNATKTRVTKITMHMVLIIIIPMTGRRKRHATTVARQDTSSRNAGIIIKIIMDTIMSGITIVMVIIGTITRHSTMKMTRAAATAAAALKVSATYRS
jgi:hypothetical protein